MFVAEGVNESSALHLHISAPPDRHIRDRPLAMVKTDQQNESKLNYTPLKSTLQLNSY